MQVDRNPFPSGNDISMVSTSRLPDRPRYNDGGVFWVVEKVEVVLANHHLFSKEGPSTKVHILFPFHVVDYGDNLSGRIL